MTALVWDQVGDRRYETGVDHGVLFLQDGRAVPWNGLTGVSDSTSRDSNSFFLDGVKFLERQTRSPFAATLKAFTYPGEFDEVNGTKRVGDGLFYHGQAARSFNLVYRTRVGNDLEGDDHGYKLHIFYNVMALPTVGDFATTGADTKAIEFSWTLSSTPPVAIGYGPTAHVSIDSTQIESGRLAVIEDLLYGNEISDPWLPPIGVLGIIFTTTDELTIIDVGDGTWLAVDLSDTHIHFTDPTTFEIDNANAVYLNVDTYQISNTP